MRLAETQIIMGSKEPTSSSGEQRRLIRLVGCPGWFESSQGACLSFVSLVVLELKSEKIRLYMGRAKRLWYLLPMRAAKVQASLRIRAVSPEPPLLVQTRSDSRGTFRQSQILTPLNGWACIVKICHHGMLEDTNSLDGPHIVFSSFFRRLKKTC